MAVENTPMCYGLFCLTRPNKVVYDHQVTIYHILFTDMGICVYTILAGIVYVVAKMVRLAQQASFVSLIFVVIGNLFMMFNAYTCRRSVETFSQRAMARQSTCCYRMVRM